MKKIQAKDKAHLQDLIKDVFDKGIHDLNFIDTSLVTDMSQLFVDIDTSHDFGISEWDVSQVTNMQDMFSGCESFNQDLSQWDVSQVTYMNGMFYRCKSFNQDLSRWDVSQVTSMGSMFMGCESFNQDLSRWDVSQVTHLTNMFWECSSFNQDLSRWDVSQVTDMGWMFFFCESFNQDLSRWDVSQVTNMINMFWGCESFNQDLSRWDVNQVTGMEWMFEGCKSFNQDHIPKAFYQKEKIALNIELDQVIKDLIDTLEHTNLVLALNLAKNIYKLQMTKHYLNKVIVDGFLFGKFENEEKGKAYKMKAEHIIQSL